MDRQASISKGVITTPTLRRIILDVGNYELMFSKPSEVPNKKRDYNRDSSITYVDMNHPEPRLVEFNWISS